MKSTRFISYSTRVAILIGLLLGVFFLVPLVPQFISKYAGIVPIVFSPAPQAATTTAAGLETAPGVSVSVFATELGGPRDIARGPDGRLLVSIPERGEIVSLPDINGDGRADTTNAVLSGLQKPHGLVSYCRTVSMHDQQVACGLYVAEEHQVTWYPFDSETKTYGEPEQIIDLPTGGRHTTRSLLIAPDSSLASSTDAGLPQPGDERLLISVGSSCNVCFEADDKRAAILSTDLDGNDLRIISGLRNSVFMTLQPVTGDVWATEMGRDLLGDDTPPDEINIITHGNDYGFPICYGNNIHDSNFDTRQYVRNPCTDMTPSHIGVVPAHSAPLGIAFVPEEGWPEDMWYNALVAMHGSWNRTDPVGYKVARYALTPDGEPMQNENGAAVVHDFISGWRTDAGEIRGRPVDVLLEPGGVGYISDDHAGVVYRFTVRPE